MRRCISSFEKNGVKEHKKSGIHLKSEHPINLSADLFLSNYFAGAGSVAGAGTALAAGAG
jgi:hypothetical protein